MQATDDFKSWFGRYLELWVPLLRGNIEGNDDPVGKPSFPNMIMVVPVDPGRPTILSDVDMDDKARLMLTMRDLSSHDDLVAAAVLVVEAWTLRADAMPAGSIANHPDRSEAVIFSAMRGTQQLIAVAPIVVRDGRRTLGEPTVEKETT